MKRTIFLIGGSGFIGKNIIRNLYAQYQIYVFDKYIDHVFFEAYPQVNVSELDLVQDKIPESVVSPDYIVNLASIVTAERDLTLFDNLISSNLKILLNLYERFKGNFSLKLFIQFGSSEEYGAKISPFKEEEREYPSSPYALVKQLTTNTAMMLYYNYNFPVMVVRPANLFGPYQSASKFIPYIVERLKTNQPLDVSPCEQKRDFIHVDDFVFAINGLLVNYKKSVGEIINVGSGCSISLKEIIETCKEELQSTSKVNYGALAYRENEAMDLCCSINKLNGIIGQEKVKTGILEYLK